jgi:hypothetical protein
MSQWRTDPIEEIETRIVNGAETAAVIATEMTVVAGIAAS